MKVSMIMPVYNSAQYLRSAADSVILQDFEDFEVLLIDDGSTDGSGEICDEYAAAYEHVRVIHQQNGGICAARNRGIDLALGEYIGFCDNDDLLLPGALADSYERAKKDDLDLIRFNRAKRYEKKNGKVWETTLDFPDEIIEREEFPQKFRQIRQHTVWTALYRAEVIRKNSIRFNEEMHCGNEDVHFNLQFLPYCRKMGLNPKVYYWWQQRDTHSTSRKFSVEGVQSWFCCLPLENRFFSETCAGKVSNFEKNRHLVNIYIYQLAEYFSIPDCSLTSEQKKTYLQKLRQDPLFDDRLAGETAAAAWHDSKRTWLLMKLFYAGKYGMLLWIVRNGMRLLSIVRFR